MIANEHCDHVMSILAYLRVRTFWLSGDDLYFVNSPCLVLQSVIVMVQ